MPGGSFVNLSSLIEAMGIVSHDEKELDLSDDESGLELAGTKVSEGTSNFVKDIEKVEFSDPKLMWVGQADEDTTVNDLRKKYDLDTEYSKSLTSEEIDAINGTAINKGEWVLLGIKSFDTEEALTITMNTGEVFTIKVTDPHDAPTVPGNEHLVQTIPNPSGTTIDMFDYWIDSETEAGRRGWLGYRRDGSTDGITDSNFWNNFINDNTDSNGNNVGINHNHKLKFVPSMGGQVIDYRNSNGNEIIGRNQHYNGSWVDHGYDNRTKDGTIGGINSWNGWNDGSNHYNGIPTQGIIADALYNANGQLDANGYPRLDIGNGAENTESLDYLFNTGTNHAGKKSYGGANNLFYVDPDGYYTYDSMFYKASMDKNTKLFTVQDHNPNDNTNGIRGFWPMGDLNYWLGMHMKTEFSVPANGEVLNPKGVYKPMQFEFSGDDDAWAYIDGILVADGGGVHNRTELDINFKTGVVKVIGGVYTDLTNPNMDVVSEKTLYQIFSEAHNNGLITDEKWNSYHWVDADGDGTPDTFEQGTNLTFDFFYLERGGGESNLYIHYNLISTTDFSAHKSYHMLQNDPNARLKRDQFKFELIGFDGDSSYEGETRHAVMPDKGTPSGDGTFASPYKEHSDSSPGGAGVPAGMTAHTKMIIGVTEDGNVNFGDVEISPAYAGKQYKYMVREVVPADAVNADGIRWDAANDELKSEGGFVKDGITYDGRVYYFIGTVVEDPDRIGFYKLKKTRYTDSTYTTEDKETKFFSFVNGHVEPLTLKVLKRDETGETPLNGAQFSLTRAMKSQDDKWVIRTYQVGDETVEATPRTGTTRQGSLSFDNLTEGHFILEETAAPAGYEKKDPHRWLFILTKVDEENEIVLIPTIQGLDDNGNLIGEERTLTADSQNTVEYQVLNEPKKIRLSLKKEWPGGIPDNTTATFQLKRYRTYTKPDEVPMVDVYIRYADSYQSYANGGCNTGMHIQVPAHAQVRFGYSGFNASTTNFVYPWLSVYVGGSGAGHSEVLINGRYDTTYTVGTQEVCFWLYANHGNISPTDSRFRYTLEYVNGTGDRPGPGETVTEEDPSFTAENIKVDLPHDNKWEYQFDAYPVMGTNATYHVPETYTYFIEETPEVDGYEVVYDRMNGNDIAGSTDSEERTIWNIKKIDVPVNKTWDWSESDANRVDHWDATFKLEYREVLVSGEPATDAVHSWRVVDGKQLTIHNGDSGDAIKFKDLPMYRKHSNGSIYRIIYAVDETAYHVYDSNNSLIARWTKDGSESTVGTVYAPDYEQDAGESDQPEDPDDWPEWYTISLTNDVKETSIEETIDLAVQKKWFDAEGQQFDPGDDAYAKFQLRRYVYEEYRDYSKQGVDTTNWVDVTLDLGNGIQKKITVPKGAPVHVSGLAKPGKNVDITFTAPGNTALEMKLDNSSSTKAAVADTSAFNPQSNCTITLDSGSTGSIIGGLEGIRLACYDEKQTMRIDESFNVEHDGHIEPAGQVFTLNNSNNWQKDWVELPYVVESKLDDNTQTVYVYSYFLEEKGSNPENYISTFRNSADEELGDSNIPVDYSTTVIAENVESTDVKVKKIWDDNNDSKHKRPVSLTVTLLKDGAATDKSVTLSEANHWEDIIEDLPKYSNGVPINYQWLESDLPDGYFLTHVSTSESDGVAVTTLTNTLSEYDLKTSYVGVKTWEDFDNQYLTRPHELPVTLYANGQPTEHVATWVEGPEDNQWTYTFTDIPVFDENGDIIKYTVEEDEPSGYEMTDETSRETVGTIGEIIYEDGKDRVTPDNQIVWDLGSIIDLTFIAIKPTAHGDIPVWTSRTPVPAERQALISAIRGGAIPGASGRNIVFYSGECVIPTPHGDINVTLSGDSLHVILDLGATNISSQFIVGQFNKNDSSEYYPGATSFTNTLETTRLEGTKMWAIDPGVEHPDPILKLTRTTTSIDIDGNPHVSDPEVVKVNNADLQPEWSGDSETSRHFTYDHLPKYSTEGKEYTYSVEEASFTIGSGDDAVVYTAVKNSDGTYTVTADKPDADPYVTTQDANVITNRPLRADLEVIKVEENHLESSHHLSGAVFRLTRVDNDGHDVTGQNSYSEEKTVDSETGKADFTGLKPGRYKLEEREAPTGYIIVESPWYFVVDSTAHISLEAQYEMATPSAVDNQFYIENRPGTELPSAGGPGTTWIYLLGAILALGSAIMLAARLRARLAE